MAMGGMNHSMNTMNSPVPSALPSALQFVEQANLVNSAECPRESRSEISQELVSLAKR